MIRKLLETDDFTLGLTFFAIAIGLVLLGRFMLSGG